MSDTARFERDRWSTAVLALSCAWWIVVLGVLRCGVPAPLDDSWEYGLVARHLLDGQGFRTTAIHPPLWPLLDERLTVPVLVHGPLLSLLLVPVVWIAKQSAIGALAWFAALFASLAAFVLARSAARAVGPRDAAVAALLFTLSPLTLRAVIHDASFAIGSFWLILAVDRWTARRPLTAGLAAGVGALARPEFAFVILVLAAFAHGGRARMLLGFAIPWSPWAWHQTIASGTPLFNLSSYLLISYTRLYPELTALRSFDLSPDRWPAAASAALPDLWTKWLHAMPRAFKHLLAAPALVIGAFAPIGLVAASRRPAEGAGHFWLASIALLGIPLALMVVAERRPATVVTFLPLWTLAVTIGARVTFARFRVLQGSVALALLALLAVPSALLAVRQQAREARANEAWLERERSGLIARFGRQYRAGAAAAAPPAAASPLVFSDTPDFVSWVTGRPAVWVTRAELDGRYEMATRAGVPLPAGFPAAREDAATWFHEDPGSLR